VSDAGVREEGVEGDDADIDEPDKHDDKGDDEEEA
tara:strand:+ start:720 stop:824 length:105 start_codon:yes stop_codon:yes gene_type:complete